MNLHMPQDPESESELRNLAAVPYQIVSPANNSSIIGIYQDSMLGSYQFTRPNLKFTPRDAMNILMMFNNVNEDKLKTAIQKNGYISNFDILSQIMPPLSMKYKTKAFKDGDDSSTSNAIIEIKNGEYIRGQMDKSVLGARSKGLLQRVCNDFGNMASSKFIDDLQNVVTEYMKSTAFSVGISDLISDQRTNDEIIQVITKKKTDVKNLIDQVQIGIFENNTGKTNEEEFETQVNSILNQATSESGKIGLKNLSKTNRFVIMVQAGSKGSDLNISQMISCLGQQNVDGKRIPYGFENRTLPHYTKYDDSPSARGFVESSYINGLSPQELFFHAMGGRVGLIDTAVKTSTTGYIQRRLIKALEDLMVSYDMTVRTNKMKIVQFSYGDDNIDTTKVEDQTIPVVSMSTQDIYSHYLLPEDTANKLLNNVFLKNVLTRHKKQNAEFMEKIAVLIQMMIKNRDLLIKNVFRNKSESNVGCPVAFQYIINNVQGQCTINSSSMVDLTLLEALNMIENAYNNLLKLNYSSPTELFKTLYFYYLSPKELLVSKRFNKASLSLLLDNITLNYKKAIVAPGEMVGMIAGQSIGEVSTQMSVPYNTQHKLIIFDKTTKVAHYENIIIGKFVDNLMQEFPQYTFNTGHHDSYETLLEKANLEYYIQSVSEDQATMWSKLSHVSRHPVNGSLMKITTQSGRTVESTLSHSHLICNNKKVVPIKGAELKVGMCIPVCKYLKSFDDFIGDCVVLSDGTHQMLDIRFANALVNYYVFKGNEMYFEDISRATVEFIKENCGTNSAEYGLPQCVYNGPLSFRLNLVNKLFEQEFASKQLMKDIAVLASTCNIFTTFVTTVENNKVVKYVLPGENETNDYIQYLHQDIVWDEIVDIVIYEPSQTDYVYDFTVPGNQTFMTDEGIFVHNTLNTFHFAGVASKSNVTRGVPRIEEILSLSSNIKNPSISVYLKHEDETSKEKAQTIMYMLEHTKLQDIVKLTEICFDPDDLNTLIAEDRSCIEQYRAFENMVSECSGQNMEGDDEEKSKWIIRMVMDPEAMLEKNITMDDVNFTLKHCYENQISCIYSDFNSDKLIFRIRMNDVLKSKNKGGQSKTKVNPLDQSDHIYILKNFQEQLLENIVLRGVTGINKVIVRKIVDNLIEHNGGYKKQDIWVLDTVGTNLLEVLGLDYIDNTRTISNDIVEIYNVLGIEAARQAIYDELSEVVEFDGTYINYHNYSVLVDRMTFSHKLISIFRHGINNDDIGPIAKASFEETPQMFLKAARHAELDTMRGVSANVMCGQEGFFGTAAFQVVLDIEEMQKMEQTSEYKPLDVQEEIENFFGKIENPDDPCSVNKIAIQNNAITLKSVDVGEDDDDYNPGF
jgi:DNA-directed RNA polymerase beta' subunit